MLITHLLWDLVLLPPPPSLTRTRDTINTALQPLRELSVSSIPLFFHIPYPLLPPSPLPPPSPPAVYDEAVLGVAHRSHESSAAEFTNVHTPQIHSSAAGVNSVSTTWAGKRSTEATWAVEAEGATTETTGATVVTHHVGQMLVNMGEYGWIWVNMRVNTQIALVNMGEYDIHFGWIRYSRGIHQGRFCARFHQCFAHISNHNLGVLTSYWRGKSSISCESSYWDHNVGRIDGNRVFCDLVWTDAIKHFMISIGQNKVIVRVSLEYIDVIVLGIVV